MNLLFTIHDEILQPLSFTDKNSLDISETDEFIISQSIGKLFNLPVLKNKTHAIIDVLAWDGKNMQLNAVFYIPTSTESRLKYLFLDIVGYKDCIIENAKKELIQYGVSEKQDIALKFVFIQNNVGEQSRNDYEYALQHPQAAHVIIEYFEVFKTDRGIFSLQPYYYKRYIINDVKQPIEIYNENYHLLLSDSDIQDIYIQIKSLVLNKYPNITIKDSFKTAIQFVYNGVCILSFVFKKDFIKIWLNYKNSKSFTNSQNLFIPIGTKNHHGVGDYFCDMDLEGYVNLDINELYRLIDMTIKSYG